MSDIQTIERKIIKKSEGERFKNVIRVVVYVVDGQEKQPKLEKRQFFKNQNDEWRMGKAQGFNYDEIEYLAINWDNEIKPAMLGTESLPPKEKDQAVPF